MPFPYARLTNISMYFLFGNWTCLALGRELAFSLHGTQLTLPVTDFAYFYNHRKDVCVLRFMASKHGWLLVFGLYKDDYLTKNHVIVITQLSQFVVGLGFG